MPRPKGSKNKPAAARPQHTDIQQTIGTQGNIEEDISKVKAEIEATELKLKDLKAELNRLNKLQVKQQQEAVMAAIAASGKSFDEILAIINGLSAKEELAEESAEEPTEELTEEPTDEPKPNTEE